MSRGSKSRRVKRRRLRRRCNKIKHLLWGLGEGLLRSRVSMIANNQSDATLLTYVQHVDRLWTRFTAEVEPFADNILEYPGKEFVVYEIFVELKAIKSHCENLGFHIFTSP